MTEKSTTSYAVPALLYLLIVSTTFSPDVLPVLIKAFGAAPLDLPVDAVIAGIVAVVFLPFAYSVHHFVLIAERAATEGHGVGKIGLLSYAFSAGRRHPELRRSQRISLAGLVYFLLVCGGWTIYAGSKGI